MKTCHRYRCYVINQVFISRLQGCVHFCYSSFVLFTRIATYINRVVSRDCCKQCFCIVYSKWIMTVGNNSAGVSSCDAIFGICVWKTERIINTTYIRRKFFFVVIVFGMCVSGGDVRWGTRCRIWWSVYFYTGGMNRYFVNGFDVN